MTSASDVEPRLPRGDWLNERTYVVPEFKGHLRRSTLRVGGNCRLCPFSVCCVGNFWGNC